MKAPDGLHCPKCQSTVLRTLDSRKQNGTVRRRRECHKCGERFYTVEAVEERA